jgi:hypothetical protein
MVGTARIVDLQARRFVIDVVAIKPKIARP